jgi:nucleoside-diphosphate-sugar epimerase
MKVLVLGASGNLGQRVVAALLTHGQTVVAYVRSSQKLESLLPATVFRQISVVQGDATDSTAIKRAILDNNCDAVVNTAGLAAMAPWSSTDLPIIFGTVVQAIRDAGTARKKAVRAWFLAGIGVMGLPQTNWMLSD